jgi:outer membrane protein TolC
MSIIQFDLMNLVRIFYSKFVLLICFAGSFLPINKSEAQIKIGDTLKVLSPEQFINWVKEYHPLARQAGLFIDQAEAELLATRGLFDPMIYYTNEQKTFDGKNYYNYSNTNLKIPTWFGVELAAGLENNLGDFTNPELSPAKSSYAGLSVPLAKNLLMDNRRAALQQAKFFVDLSESEQRLAINDLLFDALDMYFQWANEYQGYLILTDAVNTNEIRYEQIKVTVEQGDRAGVDSTEALTQLLQFQFQQNEAYMRFINTGYLLSNFLWDENERPILLTSNVIPAILPELSNPFAREFRPLDDLLQLAASNHPKLRVYDSKLDILEVERRLKFQSLLPTVNLKYNALADGYQFWRGWNSTMLDNNYKFGAELGIPIFLRQGRGDYRGAKLKIRSTELEQSAARLDIDNKVKYYYNELVNLLVQIRINERAFAAYKRVFDVEVQKFELGESTLFLLNNRELKVLESRQKLAELKAKFFKTAYGVEWAAGLLQ